MLGILLIALVYVLATDDDKPADKKPADVKPEPKQTVATFTTKDGKQVKIERKAQETDDA
jgi:cephalosporin hydroxylase